MNITSLRRSVHDKHTLNLGRGVACVLATVFLVSCLVLSNGARPASAVSVRGMTSRGVLGSTARPAPPVGSINPASQDEFDLENDQSGRCGGAGCQRNFLTCYTPGTFISWVSGCCAQCCWDADPSSCSSANCCSSN